MIGIEFGSEVVMLDRHVSVFDSDKFVEEETSKKMLRDEVDKIDQFELMRIID